MGYLANPWIWIVAAIGFSIVSGLGLVARRVLAYASAARQRNGRASSIRVEAVKVLVSSLFAATMLLCTFFLRRQGGENGGFYIVSFGLGGCAGLPMGLYLQGLFRGISSSGSPPPDP